MELILLEDVENLGRRGERVVVKDGHARNFLLPRKLALPATDRGVKMMQHVEKMRAVREQKVHREELSLLPDE